mgnify:CR=1 FL=1
MVARSRRRERPPPHRLGVACPKPTTARALEGRPNPPAPQRQWPPWKRWDRRVWSLRELLLELLRPVLPRVQGRGSRLINPRRFNRSVLLERV